LNQIFSELLNIYKFRGLVHASGSQIQVRTESVRDVLTTLTVIVGAFAAIVAISHAKAVRLVDLI